MAVKRIPHSVQTKLPLLFVLIDQALSPISHVTVLPFAEAAPVSG